MLHHVAPNTCIQCQPNTKYRLCPGRAMMSATISIDSALRRHASSGSAVREGRPVDHSMGPGPMQLKEGHRQA